MKKILLISLVLCWTVSHAQWGASKKEDVDAVKARTLLVIVEEPNQELIKKLNADEKDFYVKEVDDYNAMMKEVMPKYWKWNDKVEFKTRTEVEGLVKSKSKDYAFIEHNKFKSNFANKAALNATRSLKKGEMMLMGADYVETAMLVRLTDENPLGNPVYGVYLPSPFPTNGEMVYGLKQLQLQFKLKSQGMKDIPISNSYKENAKQLASKTLLLDKNTIFSQNEEEIKKVYPYPFKLVDKTQIDQAFMSEDPNSTTFVFIARAGGKTSTEIVNTNAGEKMGAANNDWSTGFSITTPEVDKWTKEGTKGTIRKDDLKMLAKQVKG